MTIRDLVILGCSSQHPTRLRNHGAYLVRWNGEGLLFDPGEGTQRQLIFANIAPPTINRIFISHFHGDHCWGLGSVLQRLNLDKVKHPIHCYYPAGGKKYFDRLRYGTICHESIEVIEHPVTEEGVVHDDGCFRIEAAFLDHRVENVGWRIIEPDTRKFDREKLKAHGVLGPLVKTLEREGVLMVDGKLVTLDEVSRVRPGDVVAVVIDTRPCEAALRLARGARLLLCESTFLEEHKDLAHKYYHMTVKQAASLAKESGAKELVVTHFSARYQDLQPFSREGRQVFDNLRVADDFKTFPFPKNP